MEHIIVHSASNVSQPYWTCLVHTRLNTATLHHRSKSSHFCHIMEALRSRSDTPILVITRSTITLRSLCSRRRGTTRQEQSQNYFASIAVRTDMSIVRACCSSILRQGALSISNPGMLSRSQYASICPTKNSIMTRILESSQFNSN